MKDDDLLARVAALNAAVDLTTGLMRPVDQAMRPRDVIEVLGVADRMLAWLVEVDE